MKKVTYFDALKATHKPQKGTTTFDMERWEKAEEFLPQCKRIIIKNSLDIYNNSTTRISKEALQRAIPPFPHIFVEYDPPVNIFSKDGNPTGRGVLLWGMQISDITVNPSEAEVNHPIKSLIYVPHVFSERKKSYGIAPSVIVAKGGIDGNFAILCKKESSEFDQKYNDSIGSFGDLTLLFLNSDNIKLVSKGAGPKRNEIRRRMGMKELPLPYYVCKVSFPKRYFKNRNIVRKGSSFRFCFDVRGHFRTFRHKRYTKMRWKTIWVPPYQKGPQGSIYIPKTYEFEEDSK